MIGDRDVFVVGHQRIVGAKQPAGIGGVKDRGEEIGEVADPHRQQQFDFGERREMPRDVLALRGIAAQQPRQAGPQRGPGLRTALHQRVEVRRRAGGRRGRGGAVEKAAARRDVENLVADGDADPRGLAALPEHRIGQVLDREIAVRRIGARNEAAQRGIVSFVEVHCDT